LSTQEEVLTQQLSSETDEHFEEDPRFKICNREALILALITVIYLILQVVVGQVLGKVGPEQIILVMGLPGWFFYSVFLIPVIFIALVALIIKFFFVDLPLD
jgi:uncharacterized membrane protein YhdT